MKILALLAVLVATASSASAACMGPEGLPEPGAMPQPVAGRFVRTADRNLACAVANDVGQSMAHGTKPTSFLPCLRIGAVAISQGLRQVEEALGPPDAITAIDWRTEARGYFIAQRSIPHPYYVVTYQDDVAVAMQLMGPPTEMPAGFSGLALGDTIQAVIDQLGKPSRRCPGKGKGIETWVWSPFPIAIDVMDGHVLGFKVTWITGR
ncbi:hypothetical protein A6A05_10620 [Magnetospirillum moscoviense]|uniref:Uncharacterized protein n=1 Tax=Magnetospirillum moscoviense TaxID=1437059 RepID=A0A178MSR2_9PROT|nr:hypothetical protein A6A05_10620 [Magnetospirillum moscoviense]